MNTYVIERKRKRNIINNIVRSIACKIFQKQGRYKFSAAYEKLRARMLIDWDINISDRLKGTDCESMFDVLGDEELDMALQSCLKLCNMYHIDINKCA